MTPCLKKNSSCSSTHLVYDCYVLHPPPICTSSIAPSTALMGMFSNCSHWEYTLNGSVELSVLFFWFLSLLSLLKWLAKTLSLHFIASKASDMDSLRYFLHIPFFITPDVCIFFLCGIKYLNISVLFVSETGVIDNIVYQYEGYHLSCREHKSPADGSEWSCDYSSAIQIKHFLDFR